MDYLKRNELVVGRRAAGDEEEGGIAAVDYFCICETSRLAVSRVEACGRGDLPLYSRKLHMRVLRERTSWETSLMIFALSLGESVVNHFARRCCGKFV